MFTSQYSKSRFSWLLSPLALPPQPQCPEHELEEACLFMQECWQVLPGIIPKFLTWVGKQAQDSPSVKQLSSNAIALAKYAQIQNNLSTHVARILSEKGIPYVFLKGSALRWTVYASPVERVGCDLDLAVPPCQLEQCRLVVKDMGFDAAQWNKALSRFEKPNPILRKVVESRHHELGFLVHRSRVEGIPLEVETAIRSQLQERPDLWFVTSDDELNSYVRLDIHHGIARKVHITVDPIIDSCCIVEANGIKHNVPRPSWLLLHLVFKIYWEGVSAYGKGVYQYADVCRLIPSVIGNEYEHFRSLLAQWNLEAAAYFVIRRLPSIFGIQLSEEFSSLLEETSRPTKDTTPDEENDRGDMWPKLWGHR